MSYTREVSRSVQFGPNGANTAVPPPTWSVSIPDIKQGEKVERYRERIRKGEIASSNYVRDTYIVKEKKPGNAEYITTDYTYEGMQSPPNETRIVASGYTAGTHRVPTSHLSTNISAIDGAALTLLYRKIRKESSEMNGLQFFGELRESLRMIRKPAAAFQKGLLEYDRLLKNRKKSVHRNIPLEKKLDIWKDIIAGTWLEVSFGWRPLVSDTQAIAETIARVVSKDDLRTRARSYFEGNLGTSQYEIDGGFSNVSEIPTTTVVDTISNGGVQYVCQLKGSPLGPMHALDRIRSLSGLTLENFVPTLYELTPWSFLLDYFTNVGDIVEAACTNTVSVGWVVRTKRFQTARIVKATARPKIANYINPPFLNFKSFTTDGAGFSHIVKSTVQREIITSLGVPDLVFTLPGNPIKYANIAALMSPLYHSRFRF